MSYKLYLQFISQLSSKKIVCLDLEDYFIWMEKIENGRWRLSTKIYDGHGCIPSEVRSCISSIGNLHWQQKGAFLQLNDKNHTINLIQETEISNNGYLSFKNCIDDFCQVTKEWKQLFYELDPNSIHIPTI